MNASRTTVVVASAALVGAGILLFLRSRKAGGDKGSAQGRFNAPRAKRSLLGALRAQWDKEVAAGGDDGTQWFSK